MLNRRILRSKALQLAYGFYSSRKANHQMALDRIRLHYAPDLNSLEEQDKGELKKKEKEAAELFKRNDFEASDKDMTEALYEARHFYEEQTKKDINSYRKQLTNHAESIFDLYLKALLLLVKLSDMVNIEAIETVKNRPMAPKPDEETLKFYNNKIVELIRSDKDFQKACEKRKINWGDDQDFIESLFKEGLKKNKEYKKYIERNSKDLRFEDEIEIARTVLNEIVLNHPASIAQFESIDISWFQNKSIVKSMLKFTLKSIDEKSDKFPFAPLAKNWEDDKSFYEKLFNLTIENDAEYEELIASKAKNWESERVSLMDKIILKLAMCELEHFPSIPVKVTINEFIDLSKQYSTPKSKTFVNGILDKVKQEWLKSKKIKKSGRGLIDNN
ncbi:transcription antitermination factor NusB [Hyphobacterium sp. CCMP332]|nr:transcription antitermination factor NusB [Hyphobacterium sp. CCMP332]